MIQSQLPESTEFASAITRAMDGEGDNFSVNLSYAKVIAEGHYRDTESGKYLEGHWELTIEDGKVTDATYLSPYDWNAKFGYRR